MINITDSTFEEALAKSPRVLVDFGAQWCGPCKSLHPILEKLEKEYEGRVTFIKADVEECTETAEAYRIMSVPTMLCFKDGAMVPGTKMVGAMPEAKIKENLEKLLNA